MQSVPDPPFTHRLDVIRRYYRGHRDSFSLPVDSYAGWVMLAPSDGGFEFAVTDGPTRPAEWQWVAAGELVLCPPGRHLHRRMAAPVTFHFVEFSWIPPVHDGFSKLTEEITGRIAPRDPGRVLSSLSLLAALDDLPQDDSPGYAEHLVRDLLFQCLIRRRWRRQKRDQAVAAVDDELRRRFSEPLQLSQLAAEAALTPSQLTRRFRRAFGVSPVRRLTQFRIEEAAHLLTSGEATLDEIAAACGYANGFYLSRVFTRHMGVPPSIYRREHSI